MAASPDDLSQLHDLLSQSLSSALKQYKDSGEPPPASLIKEIREFLKDNGIDSTMEAGTNASELLKDAVPFLAINNQ